MTNATLAIAAAIAFGSSLVFLYLGRLIQLRGVENAYRGAFTAFAWWWYGLAALNLYPVAIIAAYLSGQLVLSLATTFLYILILVLCVALWGLVYYLAFLFTGNRRWGIPLGIFYGLYYVWLLYLVIVANPNGFRVTDWSVSIRYERELATGPVNVLLSIFLFAPPILGALAYFSLFFRTRDAEARYRIGMVALTIAGWFGSSVVASVLRLSTKIPVWPLVSRLIPLAAALLILAAYKPPRWVRERLSRAKQEPLAT